MLIALRRGGWLEALFYGAMLGTGIGALGHGLGAPFWLSISIECVIAIPLGVQVSRRHARMATK